MGYIIIKGAKYRLTFTMKQWEFEDELQKIKARSGMLTAYTCTVYSAIMAANMMECPDDNVLCYDLVEMTLDNIVSENTREWQNIKDEINRCYAYETTNKTEGEKEKINFTKVKRFAYGYLKLSIAEYENMKPCDYFLLVEGYNQKVLDERRFARLQTFLSMAPHMDKNFTCNTMLKLMPLSGDEKEKTEVIKISSEMHMQIQAAHKKRR